MRRVMSSRFPIGVGQTTSLPGIRRIRVLSARSPCRARSGPSPRRRSCPRPARARPASTGVSFCGGSARARSSSRAGSSSRSPTAETPPPITNTSGSKMLARLRERDAEVAAGLRHHLAGGTIARRARARSPCALRSAPRRAPCPAPSRVALGGRLPGLARSRCRRQASRRSHGWGSCPGRAGRPRRSRCARAPPPAPVEPAVDLAVEDQPPADAGADREHHHVPRAAARAVEELGEGGDVGVVVDEDREPEPLPASGRGSGRR